MTISPVAINNQTLVKLCLHAYTTPSLVTAYSLFMLPKLLISTVVSLITVVAAQGGYFKSGYYTIEVPNEGQFVLSETVASKPIRISSDAPPENRVWHLKLQMYPSPRYLIQNRGTSHMAHARRGVPGELVYAESKSGFFHITESTTKNLYNIAFDAYNVLVWTRSTNNDTVTIEQNTHQSTNQLWNITRDDSTRVKSAIITSPEAGSQQHLESTTEELSGC